MEELRVSPDDRAFYFGDGVYEVVKVLDGKFFAADLHLDRLYRSAAGIELEIPWTKDEIMSVLAKLVADSGYRDSLVYFQVSRGIAPRKHYYPAAGTAPSFCAWAKHFGGPAPGLHDNGVKLVTTPDVRWPKAWIKSINLLPNAMAADAAHRAGAYEAALVDRADGLVNECSAANLFAVIDGVVRTAPKNRNILWGVSRHVAINCAVSAGVPLEERAFSVPEMLNAQEVFLTSTSPDLLGVVDIDGHKIGGGKPGPVTQKLLELFRHYIRTGEYRKG
jgi:D-alanine transaminase